MSMQIIPRFLKLTATRKAQQVDRMGRPTLVYPYLVGFYTLLRGATHISDCSWGSAQRLHYHLGTQQKLLHLCNISALLSLCVFLSFLQSHFGWRWRATPGRSSLNWMYLWNRLHWVRAVTRGRSRRPSGLIHNRLLNTKMQVLSK